MKHGSITMRTCMTTDFTVGMAGTTFVWGCDADKRGHEGKIFERRNPSIGEGWED